MDKVTVNLEQGTWAIAEVSSGRKVSECFLFKGTDVLQYMSNFCESSSDFDPNSKTLTATGSSIPQSRNIPGYCYEINGVKKHVEGLIQPKTLTSTNEYGYKENITWNQSSTNMPKYFGLTGDLKNGTVMWVNENYSMALIENDTSVCLKIWDSENALLVNEAKSKSSLLEPYIYFVSNKLEDITPKDLKITFTGNQDEKLLNGNGYAMTTPYLLTRLDATIKTTTTFHQAENAIGQQAIASFLSNISKLTSDCFSNKLKDTTAEVVFDNFIGSYYLNDENVDHKEWRKLWQIDHHYYQGAVKTWSTLATTRLPNLKDSLSYTKSADIYVNVDKYGSVSSAYLRYPKNTDLSIGWFRKGTMKYNRALRYYSVYAPACFVQDEEINLPLIGKQKDYWHSHMATSYWDTKNLYRDYGYPHGYTSSEGQWISIAGPVTDSFLSSWSWDEWTDWEFGIQDSWKIYKYDKDGNLEVYMDYSNETSTSVFFPRFCSWVINEDNHNNKYAKHQANYVYNNGHATYDGIQSGVCLIERGGPSNLQIAWGDAGIFSSSGTSCSFDFYESSSTFTTPTWKENRKWYILDWLWHTKKTS